MCLVRPEAGCIMQSVGEERDLERQKQRQATQYIFPIGNRSVAVESMWVRNFLRCPSFRRAVSCTIPGNLLS